MSSYQYDMQQRVIIVKGIQFLNKIRLDSTFRLNSVFINLFLNETLETPTEKMFSDAKAIKIYTIKYSFKYYIFRT